MQIKTFLLKSGVEIISDCEEVGKGSGVKSYRLRRPMQIFKVPVPSQTAQGLAIAATLMHFLPLVTSAIALPIFLSGDDLLCPPLTTSKEAEQAYLQMTTGIAIAQ